MKTILDILIGVGLLIGSIVFMGLFLWSGSAIARFLFPDKDEKKVSKVKDRQKR